jgi:hypothetical protein
MSIILDDPSDCPDIRTDWSKFQTCLEAGLPSNPDLPNEVAIDTCDKELSSTISRELPESAPKCCPLDDLWPLLLACIQDETCLKTQLRRQCQISRDTTIKAEVTRLQRSVTNQVNEWRKDQCSSMLESLDPLGRLLWKMTRWVMRIPTPLPPLVTPLGLALLDYEKAEALADSLEAQF